MKRYERLVSLRLLPRRLSHISATSVYTLPDMHGNAWYMLHCLAELGLFVFAQEQWSQVSAIYDQFDGFEAKHFVEFSALLDATFQTGSLHPRIRFIGDTLADRGKHDYLTLLIYQKLYAEHVDYTIILSNHDVLFLESYFSEGDQFLQLNTSEFPEQGLTEEEIEACYQSLRALHDDVRAQSIDKQTIVTIIEAAVIPRMKLLEVDIQPGQKPIFYSHSPTSWHMICELACCFEFNPDEVDKGWSVLPFSQQARHIEAFFNQKLQAFLTDKSLPRYIEILTDSRFHEVEYLDDEPSMVSVHGHTGTPCQFTVSDGLLEDIGLDSMIGRPFYNEGMALLFVFSNELSLVSQSSAKRRYDASGYALFDSSTDLATPAKKVCETDENEDDVKSNERVSAVKVC